MVRSDWSSGRFVQSNGIQIVVQTLSFEKLPMRAFLDQFPLIQDQNPISALNGRQSMGDDEGRAIFHQALKRVLHQPFRFGVKR